MERLLGRCARTRRPRRDPGGNCARARSADYSASPFAFKKNALHPSREGRSRERRVLRARAYERAIIRPFLVRVDEHEIGVRFNEHERSDVEEYCISEGWIKVAAGKALDRRGQPLLLKLKGRVEVYYR